MERKLLFLMLFLIGIVYAQAAPKQLPSKVDPLLGNIEWGMESPYNSKCPMVYSEFWSGQAHTGYVSTAMGQLMYYHRWPVKGTGSHKYFDEDGSKDTLSANFSATTYQWDLMRPHITNDSSSQAIDAVSTLLFHAGVATDMTYGQASYTEFTKIAPALIRYFGYDASMGYYQRDYFTEEEWDEMLKTELSEGRPVLYGGYSDDGGKRLVVIDGYNEQGLFHVNWGDDGNSNGYFSLDNLASSNWSLNNYSFKQIAISGIHKAEGEQRKAYVFTCEGLYGVDKTVARADSFDLQANYVFSSTIDTTDVYMDFVVVNDNGEHVYATTSNIYHWPYTMGRRAIKRRLSLPSSLPVGHYRAKIACRRPDSNQYERVYMKTGCIKYYDINVTSDSVSIHSAGMPKLRVVRWEVNPQPLKTDDMSTVKVIVHNDGEEFNDRLYWRMEKLDVPDSVYCPEYSPDSRTFRIKRDSDLVLTDEQYLNLPAGNYRLTLRIANGTLDTPDERVKPDTLITIEQGELQPSLVLSDYMYMDSQYKSGDSYVDVPKNNVVIYAPIRNEGEGDFHGQIVMYTRELLETENTPLDTMDVDIPAGVDSVITFRGTIMNGTVGGYYSAYVQDQTTLDRESHGWLEPDFYNGLFFILGDSVDLAVDKVGLEYRAYRLALSNNGLLKVYPSDGVTSLKAYSVEGKLMGVANGKAALNMGSAPSGTYILKISTQKGTAIRKFIKR